MLHTASRNYTRAHRIITNPPVSLKEPFQFARADPNDLSLVERKTLRALGVERLEFALKSERKQIVPQRVGRQSILLEAEKKRLEDHYGSRQQASMAGVPSVNGV
jgi:hypothetical protein